MFGRVGLGSGAQTGQLAIVNLGRGQLDRAAGGGNGRIGGKARIGFDRLHHAGGFVRLIHLHQRAHQTGMGRCVIGREIR